MLEWIASPDDVIAVRYNGKVGKTDVEETFRVVGERLARHETIASVVDLTAWEGFGSDGLPEEIREALPALKWAGRVRRKAVVTRSHAIAVWSEFAGALVRHPEVKVFTPEQLDAALEWAAATKLVV